MKHCLIGLNAVYAAKNGGGVIADMSEINDLADDAVAVFDAAGNLVDNAIPVITGDFVHFAVGRPSAQGGALVISNVQRQDFTSEVATVPSAATNKIMFVGAATTEGGDFNLPTLVDNDEAIIIVENLSKKFDDNSRTQRYTMPVMSTDTEATIVAGLVAIINADPNRIVLAADSGAALGIQFDGISNQDFRAIGLGVLSNTDITEYTLRNGVYNAALTADSTEFSVGVGTPAQVSELEYDAMINRGHSSSYRPYPGLFNVDSLVSNNNIYHIYQCTFVNHRMNNSTFASKPFRQSLAICIADDGGQNPVVDLTNILAAI